MTEKNLSFFINQNIYSLAHRLIKQLPAALKSAQLYPLDHPYFTHSLQLVQGSLESLFKYRPEVTFSLVENELYFGDMALVEDGLNQRQFISEFESRKINNLTFMAGVTREELMGFFQLMSKEVDIPLTGAELADKFKELHITHILVGEVVLSTVSTDQANSSGFSMGGAKPQFSSIEQNKAKGVFFGSINVIKKIMDETENDREFTLGQVKDIVGEMVGTVVKEEKYLLGLTTIKNYDEYTYNHSVNVAILALYLGKLLGLSGGQLQVLGEAAMLHDVGKVKIPKAILNKIGVLTPEEWQVMERHTVEGAEILSQISGINDLSISVALEHHLHFDLSGYPKVTELTAASAFSRLVTICDVYDAATSLRVYHAPVLGAKIIALIIGKKGSFFDPVLAKAFVQMMGVYPVGSLVRLDSGGLAVVQSNNLKNILRPRVVLVEETEKAGTLQMADLDEIDKKSMTFKYSVKEVLSPEAFNFDVTKYFNKESGA